MQEQPGQPGPHAPYPHPYQTVNGVLILVLGILSLTTCGCLTGIPAWVMGNNAMQLIKSGVGDPKEEQLANIGRILGIISVCLSACGVLFYGAMFAFGMAGAMLPGGSK